MFLLETAADTLSDADIVAVVDDISNGLANGLHIPKIVFSAIFAVIILIVAKILCTIIKHSLRKFSGRSKKFTLLMAQLVWKLCAALIWIIAIVAVLGIFGLDLTPVLAGLGITGVVLGFALQESISSLFCGVMIALNNPFRVGDWVDIGDISGTVVAMDLMCVTLAAGDNKKITMNNKNVWGTTIINYSHIERRRIDMVVTVRYTDNLETAKTVIRGLIESYPEVLADPAVLVEVGAYNDSSISIYVRPWVKPSDYWPVYWKFNAEVLNTLRANGLDMPFNQMDVHLYQD